MLRGKVRSDKYPDEWYEFICDAWLHDSVTRRSEKVRGGVPCRAVRDRTKRVDKETSVVQK